jgi:peptidoglycan-N-acetylglucosamine deacetylase
VLHRVIAAAAAVCAAAVVSLAVASPAVAAPPVVSVTSPSYDAPGGTVMVVITVSNVPAGYTSTASAYVGGVWGSCDSFKWNSGLSGRASQKCYINLPNKAGSWVLGGFVTLTKPGSVRLIYRGYKIIKTQGYATSPVSASVRTQIAKCYNTANNVWLTFDDGYTSQANLNQIRAAGHYVENHTNTHASLNQVSNATVNSEIAYGQAANTSPRLLRPPYGAGAYTSRLYYLAQSRGYRLCHWSSDTSDWSGVSWRTIVNKAYYGDALTAPVGAGDPLLMHLTNTQTRYALPTLITRLRDKGLVFDRLR